MLKEYHIKIQDTDEAILLALMDKFGAEVVELTPEKKDEHKTTLNSKKKAVVTSEKDGPVDHTWLFGKWKDVNIDARKLREEVWDRSHKF